MLKRKVLASAITSVYFSLAMAPVYASDTEIYIDRNNTAPISPTLMMMFDTSGSMNECVDSSAGGTCADTTKRRINVLKTAMRQILRGDATVSPAVAAAPGYIKMGLSKYHPTQGGAGYVFYPARPLDAFVQLNPNGYVTAQGKTANADAVQNTLLTLNAAQLAIGSNGSTNNNVGFQFSELKIPKGATIRQAYIQLTAAQSQSGYAKWRINAENTDSAAEYATLSAIDSRSYITNATAQDIEVPAWTTGERYRLNVTEQVQSLVSRSGWCGDNNMAFRITSVPVSGVTPGQRTAYSFEGATSDDNKPTLVVEYTMDTESTTSCVMVPRTSVITLSGNNDDVEWKALNASSTTRAIQSNSYLYANQYTTATLQNVIGLYYRALPMPYNAPIDSAYLKVKAYNTQSSVQPLSVTSFDSSNLAPFCTSTSSSSCEYGNTLNTWPVNTISSSEATWTPTGSNLVGETTYAIPVTEAVRDVVTKSGWAAGNAIGFKLRHSNTTNNNATFYARNASTTKAAQLEVNWRERVTDLRNLETVRDQIEAAVNALTVPSNTPLGAAYAEATRYLYGMSPYLNGGAPTDYDALVVNDPTAGSSTVRYVSPILPEDECSANYIFLLTDGEPNDTSDNARINMNAIINDGSTCSTSSNTATRQWDCMRKLAEYNTRLTNRIQKPIRTNTLILGPLDSARTNMAAVAAAGQGTHYDATSTAALVQAISRTIDDAASRSGTISAPGVAVNQINRISHLDQLYFAVFKPDSKYRWDGNLKRYRLDTTTLKVMDNSTPTPKVAIDADTGLFEEGTKSYWSNVVDGAQATLGGAASQLPTPASRNIFTYLGGLGSRNVPLSPMTFGTTFDNNAKTAMGLSTSSSSDDIKYKNLINWYKGYSIPDLLTYVDVSTGTVGDRKTIGAPLHSQPVLINYGFLSSATGAQLSDPDYQKNYVFFSTITGTLHGFDARSGAEVFNFIPGEKLNTLEAQFENDAQLIPEFGMDSTWTYYREDKDLNGQINSGDKVYLYGGMRMGGSNYYALNLTSLTSPTLLFAIQGGSTGFTRMGQTWSQPVITTIRLGGYSRKVMIFGGGYDPRHETAGQMFSGEDLGNQIYIVDAFTGEKLWSASGTASDSASITVSDMKFSIPSSVKAIDTNGDGFTDNLYFGDLGGQVFRIDFNKTPTSTSNLVKRVRLIAKVGQTGGTADALNQRRFYEPPASGLFTDSASRKFVTVALGSGYRSHPLNIQTDDHFFVLFDYDVMRSDLLTLTATQEALAEASGGLQAVITKANLAQLTDSSTAGADVTNKKGWFYDFTASGEKVLTKADINQTRLEFLTYLPVTGNSNCSPVVGRSRAYSMCLPNGSICVAGQTSRLVDDNVMSGISGSPQTLIIRSSSGDGTLTSILNRGSDFSLGSDQRIIPKIWPTKRWREKTRNPAD